MGDREAAAVAAEERLTTARELGDAKNESGALGLQAVLAEERGDLERAEEILKTRVAISRTQGEAGRPERRGIEYAEFLLRQGRHGDASDLLGECLASARARGDTFSGRTLPGQSRLARPDRRPADGGARAPRGRSEAPCRPRRALRHRLLHPADRRDPGRSRRSGEERRGSWLRRSRSSRRAVSSCGRWAYDAARQTLANLRVSLGEARFAAVYAEGAAMSFDEVVEYALDDLPV